MSSMSQTVSNVIPLEYVLSHVGMQRLEHCLWMDPNKDGRFMISVCLGGEEMILEVGNALTDAVAIFERIKCGSVTPCTAEDVISDYWYEKNQKCRSQVEKN